MEDTNIIALIATAIASILTALGLPHLYKHLTDTKKIQSEGACKEEIQALRMRLNQITTGVDMLLTIIESEFEDTSSHHNVIEKVKQLLTDETEKKLP